MLSRERPILMSAAMVRAILAGTKTQTRRVVLRPDRYIHIRDCVHASPHGVPGDRLWVRETWLPDPPIDGSWPGDVMWNGCGRPIDGVPDKYRQPANCIYAATWNGTTPLAWRPSIHMPRWAARITLELTEVRVQRLQEISEEDAKAEGARYFPDIPAGRYGDNGTRWSMLHESPPDTDHCLSRASLAFGQAWNEINAKRGHGWDTNPWVWALTFRRVS